VNVFVITVKKINYLLVIFPLKRKKAMIGPLKLLLPIGGSGENKLL